MKKSCLVLFLIALLLGALTACSAESSAPIAEAETAEAETTPIEDSLNINAAPANIITGKVITITEQDLTIQLAENMGNNPNMPMPNNDSEADKPENAPNDERPEQINPENMPPDSENFERPEDAQREFPANNGDRQPPNGTNNTENIILTEQTTTYTLADNLDIAEIMADMYINIILNEAGEVDQITILGNQE